MSYPENPNTIVIKNKFYPKGLSEGQVYNHYQSVKDSILNQIKGRDSWIMLLTDNNELVVKRKDFNLNKNNYDEIITGRTISILADNRKTEDFIIIDIDVPEKGDFGLAKETTFECYEILSKFHLVRRMTIRYTGKSSFHIACGLKKRHNIETLRYIFTKYLKENNKSNNFTVEFNKPKNSSLPNIDMSRLVYRAGYVLNNSLSSLGLKVTEIPIIKLRRFRKEEAKI